jgi:Flp pilus assembly protein TadD
VNLALTEAGVLQGQQKWREALAAVKRAEALLASGSGTAELHQRVQELGKDLEMAARLDDLRLQKTHYDDVGFMIGKEPAGSAYAGVFRDYGIDVLGAPAEEVADSTQARSIHGQLVTALDDWILVENDARVRERLWTIAERADPAPAAWRRSLRAAMAAKDRRALEKLATRPEAAELPPAGGYLLGQALADVGAGAKAVAVLAAVQRRHPQDFWLNYLLGIQLLWGSGVPDRSEAADGYQWPVHQMTRQNAFLRPRQPEVAAGYLRAALVARPDYPTLYVYLGLALRGREHLDEVIALNRKAIEIDRRYVEAHCNLGVALWKKGLQREAEAAYRQALDLRPDDFRLLTNLGTALAAQGKHADAEKQFRKALRLRPGFPVAHNNLGNALSRQGKLLDAEKEYREAVRRQPDLPDALVNLGITLAAQGKPAQAEKEFRAALVRWPNDARAHNSLGNALADQGKLVEAEKEFRTAVRLLPNYAKAHCNLGDVLRGQGRFVEALEALKRGHELGSRQPGWHYDTAQWIREVEQLIVLDTKLQGILQGKVQPANTAERIALARLCQENKKRYAAAARFYAEAFHKDAKLADDLRGGHRYNAACVAALAGCGEGVDAAKLDEKESARLRQQALDWLRADLTAWEQLLAREPEKARAAVQKMLRHWQKDTDFVGVRGNGLARLPEAQRQPWQQLWADVARTWKKAGGGDRKDKTKASSKGS